MSSLKLPDFGDGYLSQLNTRRPRMGLNACRRKKINSNWIVTDSEVSSPIVTDVGMYTIYDTNKVMVVVPNKVYDSIAINSTRLLKKKSMKRQKVKGEMILNSTDLKFTGIKTSAQEGKAINNDTDMDSEDCNVDYIYNFSDCCAKDMENFEKNAKIEKENSEEINDELTDVFESNMGRKSDEHTSMDYDNHGLSGENDVLLNCNLDNKNFQFYKVEGESKYILHLPFPSSIFFHGKVQLKLLSGGIESFGYMLDNQSSNKILELYSPRRCMQLNIKTKLPSSILTKDEVMAIVKKEVKLTESDTNKLWNSFRTDDALLLVEKLNSIYSPILGRYCADIDLFYEKQIIQEGSQIERDLNCLIGSTLEYERKGFTEGSDWKKIRIKNCTVLCGGKGVGKSTLLKFLINSQVAENKPILCLDFDLGQTEFTPPGCVSAVLIERPLLGPNFTHNINPEKMVFIGFVNAALDPVKYLKSVEYVIKNCRDNQHLNNIPWIVNTMGFCKGIGVDIMFNILKSVNPDLVIQINSSDKTRNFPVLLTPRAVKSLPVLNILSAEETDLSYEFIKTDSCARLKGIGFQSGFKPAYLRDLMTLSYFSPLVSFPYYSLNAAPPRWIYMSNVYLAVNDLMQSNNILRAFNGSLVGLCSLDGVTCLDKLEADDSQVGLCKIAIKPEAAASFGLGIVRGMDYEEKKIYIISPVSDDDLKNVNCLSLGFLKPPSDLFVKQEYLDKPAIYIEVSDERKIRSLKRTYKYTHHRQEDEQES